MKVFKVIFILALYLSLFDVGLSTHSYDTTDNKMLLIPAGKFLMGDSTIRTREQIEMADNKGHWVFIDSFYLYLQT